MHPSCFCLILENEREGCILPSLIDSNSRYSTVGAILHKDVLYMGIYLWWLYWWLWLCELCCLLPWTMTLDTLSLLNRFLSFWDNQWWLVLKLLNFDPDQNECDLIGLRKYRICQRRKQEGLGCLCLWNNPWGSVDQRRQRWMLWHCLVVASMGWTCFLLSPGWPLSFNLSE